MQALQLFIGNRNYSPWSMRPWVLLRAFDIAFEEVCIRLDAQLPPALSQALQQHGIAALPPAKVPLLRDGSLAIWDSLAISEYLAEKFPEKALWPQDRALRALGRSLCAEMHSGFGDLRTHCGMNIEADLRTAGHKIYAENAAVRADVARLNQIFGLAAQHAGGYLLGAFSAADAYFAPAVLRLQTYGLPLQAEAAAYRDRIMTHPAIGAWIAAARAEADFLPAYEPYRRAR